MCKATNLKFDTTMHVDNFSKRLCIQLLEIPAPTGHISSIFGDPA